MGYDNNKLVWLIQIHFLFHKFHRETYEYNPNIKMLHSFVFDKITILQISVYK